MKVFRSTVLFLNRMIDANIRRLHRNNYIVDWKMYIDFLPSIYSFICYSIWNVFIRKYIHIRNLDLLLVVVFSFGGSTGMF